MYGIDKGKVRRGGLKASVWWRELGNIGEGVVIV